MNAWRGTVSPLAYFLVSNLIRKDKRLSSSSDDSTTLLVCSSERCRKIWTFLAKSIFRVKSEASSPPASELYTYDEFKQLEKNFKRYVLMHLPSSLHQFTIVLYTIDFS